MDMMAIRRRVMLAQKKTDTSPKIAEYGVLWNRTQGGKTASPKWCITERYGINPHHGVLSIYGYIGDDDINITFQFYGTRDGGSAFSDWYYFNGKEYRKIGLMTAILQEITFSIQADKIDDAYAYIEETGQILFAGRNTPYYGYTNINDMPT